jgi:hypothetical protein
MKLILKNKLIYVNDKFYIVKKKLESSIPKYYQEPLTYESPPCLCLLLEN